VCAVDAIGFQKKLNPSLTGGGAKCATSAKSEELQMSITIAKTIAG